MKSVPIVATQSDEREKNARDLPLLSQPLDDPEGAFLMLAQADAKRAKPPRSEPGIVGADALAERTGGRQQARPQFFVGGGGTKHRVGMAEDIFAARKNG